MNGSHGISIRVPRLQSLVLDRHQGHELVSLASITANLASPLARRADHVNLCSPPVSGPSEPSDQGTPCLTRGGRSRRRRRRLSTWLLGRLLENICQSAESAHLHLGIFRRFCQRQSPIRRPSLPHAAAQPRQPLPPASEALSRQACRARPAR